jgi:hypothetical protein
MADELLVTFKRAFRFGFNSSLFQVSRHCLRISTQLILSFSLPGPESFVHGLHV